MIRLHVEVAGHKRFEKATEVESDLLGETANLLFGRFSAYRFVRQQNNRRGRR